MSNFPAIRDDIYRRMEQELPSYLSYHCLDHTKLVVERAEYIGRKEGLSKEELHLLKIACLYHDFGFTQVYKDHEEKGCEIVRRELPSKGFKPEEVEKICGMIMATKIPQNPHNLMEMVIADADLEYLGSNDFERIGSRLLKELRHFNPDLSIKEWNEIQVKFMQSHHYHTAYCRRYRQWRKRRNLDTIL